jgi:hypothetical protein
MANDAMKRIAKATLRVEKTPVGGGGPVFRPGVPVDRFAVAPEDGIGPETEEECDIYDWSDEGELVAAGETGMVKNWGFVAIPGGSRMEVVQYGSNEDGVNRYRVRNVACPAPGG